MIFFILAGGYGERARPLSLIKPKPIFPVNGKPLIRIMLKQLKDIGLKNGLINLHYMPEKIRENIKSGSEINFIYERELSGSKIIKKSSQYMKDLILIINGDIFLKIPLKDMLKKISNSDGVLLVKKHTLGYSSVEVNKDNFVGTDKENKKSLFMYTGVAILRKNVIEKINDFSFLDTLKKHNFKIKILEYSALWLDLGKPKLYFESNFKYKEYINDLAQNSLSNNVTISKDSIVKKSIVWENSIIDNESKISNCIITSNIKLSNINYRNKIITKNKVYDL